MNTRRAWTMQSGERTIHIDAWATPAEPTIVRFLRLSDSRSHLLGTDIVVRRGVDDEEATVWRVRSALPDDLEQLDCWTDDNHDVLAVLELVNWLTKDQLLAICRACAQEELGLAERALRSATDALLERQEQLDTTIKRLHAAQLRDKALSLSSEAARSSAVAIAATFHGTPEDLEMVVETLESLPGHD